MKRRTIIKHLSNILVPKSLVQLETLGMTSKDVGQLLHLKYLNKMNNLYSLTDDGRSLINYHKIDIKELVLNILREKPTSLADIYSLLPLVHPNRLHTAITQLTAHNSIVERGGLFIINKEESMNWKKMFFLEKESSEEKKEIPEEKLVKQPEEKLGMYAQIEKIVNDYGEPLFVDDVQVLLPHLTEKQISDALVYLTGQSRIYRVAKRKYAGKEYTGPTIKSNATDISERMVKAISKETTLRELEILFPDLDRGRIIATCFYLVKTGKIVKMNSGVYAPIEEQAVVLTKVLNSEIVLSSVLEKPQFVNVKLGDLAKAQEAGGDWMLALHIDPRLVKQCGWTEKQKVDMSYKPLSHQISIFESETGFPLCQGEEAFCVAFPIPEKAIKMHKPPVKPVFVPFQILEHKLVLDMAKV